ncbi:unnamed protein product [Closterium sp. Yama58-4]|nr:unnamed protein product [Closterium sp. Yama58-4]
MEVLAVPHVHAHLSTLPSRTALRQSAEARVVTISSSSSSLGRNPLRLTATRNVHGDNPFTCRSRRSRQYLQSLRRVAVRVSASQSDGDYTGESHDSAAGVADVSARHATKDELVKFISGNAEVSVMVVAATDLVKEAQTRHGMAPTAVAALGRLLMGTLLLGAMKGPDESVQVTVNGRGPIGQITAVSAQHGEVKGFAHNPLADPPLNSKGKMDVGGAVGKGVLSVIRTHPSWQSPYTGTVPLVSGEIAEDLANYLAESEQINSAMGLGVAVGKDGIVRAAGGFLVQVLPFCSDETLDKLEANVQSLGAMSDAVQRMDAVAIAHHLLQGLHPEPVLDPIVPTFGPCGLEDLKPRMLRAVESLGAEDVKKLIEERGTVEVRCEFCAEKVVFTEEDLHDLLVKAGKE